MTTKIHLICSFLSRWAYHVALLRVILTPELFAVSCGSKSLQQELLSVSRNWISCHIQGTVECLGTGSSYDLTAVLCGIIYRGIFVPKESKISGSRYRGIQGVATFLGMGPSRSAIFMNISYMQLMLALSASKRGESAGMVTLTTVLCCLSRATEGPVHAKFLLDFGIYPSMPAVSSEMA